MSHDTDSESSIGWLNHAVCHDADPDVFFPDGSTGPWLLVTEEAKTYCRRCPVLTECRTWAVNNRIEYGIYGGLSESERRRVKRQTSRRPQEPKQTAEEAFVFSKAASLEAACREIYDRYTELRDGHLVWTASRTQVHVAGRDRTYSQICFQAGHGRWPEGTVHRLCQVRWCVAPECLADKVIRAARRAAVRRARAVESGVVL